MMNPLQKIFRNIDCASEKNFLPRLQQKKFWYGIRYGFLCVLLFYFFFISAPIGFPAGVLVSIEEGMTLTEISKYFEAKKVIKSSLFFELITRVINSEEKIISGDYFFKNRFSVFTILNRVLDGEFGLQSIKITIPEGVSVKETAFILGEKFEDFNEKDFERLATKGEGYLFPDTYFFLPNVKAEQVYMEMRNNFTTRVEEIKDDLERSGKSLHEVITMASILEEEARTPETRRMIAGILWRRLELDMLLQVDAVFQYIIGKNTFELTLDDLALDSPYNTYKYKGLPPSPISNPGMGAIKAALSPQPSSYLFYLSDMDGNMHYSITFDEHKQKKALYLQ